MVNGGTSQGYSGWRFYPPFAGLIAFVTAENAMLVFNGSAWVDWNTLLDLQNLALLGINTSADATNKLAVKSAALLFDNIGNGVQAKLNKNASADTASLLYQQGYTGHAEIGLTGDNDVHVKVSPDGSTWYEALKLYRASGTLQSLAGSAAAPALAIGTSNDGWFQPASHQLAVSINGTQMGGWSANGFGRLSANPFPFLINNAEVARFDASGNLLLNTTANAQGATLGIYSTTTSGKVSQQIILDGATGTGAFYDNYSGAAAPNINIAFRTARGSLASPSAVQANDRLGWFNFRGYGATGFATGGRAGVGAFAAETWSDTAQGTYIAVQTCATGTTSLVNRLVTQASGQITLGAGSAATPALGLISGTPGGTAAGDGLFLPATGVLGFSTGGSERARFDSSGNLALGIASAAYKAHVNGTLGIAPGNSVTPANNGDVTFEFTSNTTLTIRAKGSDGTVRSVALTLA